MTLSIRLARRGDAVPIAALSRDQIEHGLGWSWTAPRVRRSIADADTNVAVALQPGGAGSGIAGFGIMKYHAEEAHLLLLAVHPQARRRGTGSALVAWLEQSALVAGVGQVYLEARLGNRAAHAFYRRLGYVEIQRVPGYYQGVETSVRLAKDLWQARPTLA